MLLRYGEGRRVVPVGNILLRSLCDTDRALLSPHLEEVIFRRGTITLRAQEKIEAIYFPESGFFSLEEGIVGSCHIEIAVVGREGLLGWPALLAASRSAHDAVVQSELVKAQRIALAPMLNACRVSPTLWMKLLSFVQSIMAQMTGTIASHLENPLGQRIARWLLMKHDRSAGDHLFFRHEDISAALCARRASITDNLHVLEGDRLIRCHRGQVIIRDRSGLELFAGSAYGSAEAHYRELIAPFGKSASIEVL